MGGAELDRDSFVIILILDNMDPQLTLNDVPDLFIGSYVKKNRNATDEEIIKAYLEQQGKQARLLGG